MIQALCAKDGAKVTFYIDEEEWPDIKTWLTRSDGDRYYHATGSDGEDLIIDREITLGIAHYEPALWEKKQKAKRAQAIQQKKRQQGKQALSPEERKILRDVMGGGPKSGPGGIIQ